MKYMLTLLAGLLSLLGSIQISEAKEEKMLIAYFSWSGNTKSIAEHIHQKVGGDLFEIEPVRPYSRDYNTCTDEAKKEQAEQARPELKTRVENLGQYDVIFLGYPNWWSSIPMPVATFLEQYDFQGKTIIPFVSHGGGGLARSVTDIVKLVPRATVAGALAVSYGGGGSLSRDIDAWLDKNGVKK